MKNIGTSGENLNSFEVAPDLVEIVAVASNSESESNRIIVYCPPIMGGSIGEEFSSVLLQRTKSIYAIDVQKYGYPDFDKYVEQAKLKLEQLPDFSLDNLVLVGFSEGASLAARLGQAFELQRNRVFLLAPITSFKPSLDRWKAWRELRHYGNTNHAHDNEPYLKRLLGSPERLYSSTFTMSVVDQFKALNRARLQWSCNNNDLKHGLVVTGKRDYISPPGKHSFVSVDASHSLIDYMDYLNEALK